MERAWRPSPRSKVAIWEVPCPRVPWTPAFTVDSEPARALLASIGHRWFTKKGVGVVGPSTWLWTAQGGAWEGCWNYSCRPQDGKYICPFPGCGASEPVGEDSGDEGEGRRGIKTETGDGDRKTNKQSSGLNVITAHCRREHTNTALVCIFCSSWAGYDLRWFQQHTCPCGPRQGLKPSASRRTTS